MLVVDGPSNGTADMSSDSTVTPQPQDEPIDITAPGPPVLPPALEYPPDPPDTKEGIEELCPVCGDKVSGYHYGLLTCESCKGFFKRTVQNKKVYQCVADRSCHIDKSQRKRCPYCRFQKCLDVGMKLEAVRADRMRGGRNKFGPMYKRDRARKLQMMRQKQIARAQCQGALEPPPGNEVVPVGPTPFPPPLASPSLYPPDHIKQELIQIPQLSSSTSSPDSSPSPLCAPAPHYALAISAPEPLKSPWSSMQGPPPPPHGGGASPKQPLPPPPPPQFSTLVGGGGGGESLGGGKVPVLIREFQMSMPDDKEWQSNLFGLLQNQTYNQCEVDGFELMCKVIDQSLFAQVDWARNSIFFKDLKVPESKRYSVEQTRSRKLRFKRTKSVLIQYMVDDQMKLLQQSWSDMLILDHLHQRLHNGLPEETTMPNGQKFSLVNLSLLGVANMVDQLNHVSARLQELKFDPLDYICLKFLLLLNPEVRTLNNMKLVHEAHERTQQALMEYTINCYPQISDKFTHLLQLLPEVHVISERGEEFLLYRHLNGNAPSQTLLMEMLHTKKK